MKKVGLYGGTFDPIHAGHINLALELMEKQHLDEVWFIPAQINPHKSQSPPTSISHRLEMVKEAIRDIPSFHLKDLEARRPPPSYTIDTLRFLMNCEDQQTAPKQFYLLLGEDSIPGFMKWHQYEEIIQRVPLLIGSRSGHWDKRINLPPALQQAVEKGMIKTHVLDISSTELRTRLSQDLYCGHLIPARVLEYIKKNQLYQLNDRI